MLKSIVLWLIRSYQRYLSPHKGFGCAYRIHTGGASCSGFGYQAVQKHGAWVGLQLIYRRLAKCAWQHAQHPAVRTATSTSLQLPAHLRVQQGGYCDVPCDGAACDGAACDVGSCDLPTCDALSCDTPHLKGCAFDVVESCACDFCSSPLPSDCGSGGATREENRLARAKNRRDARNAATQNEEVPSDGDAPEDDGD